VLTPSLDEHILTSIIRRVVIVTVTPLVVLV